MRPLSLSPPIRSYDEAMLEEAIAWRRALRSPHGPYCGSACDHKTGQHIAGCAWSYGIFRIYELERQLGL
jgi:hypothetical protein